jgi:hypothetical protein
VRVFSSTSVFKYIDDKFFPKENNKMPFDGFLGLDTVLIQEKYK